MRNLDALAAWLTRAGHALGHWLARRGTFGVCVLALLLFVVLGLGWLAISALGIQ